MVPRKQRGQSRWRHLALPLVIIRALCWYLPLYTARAAHKKAKEKAVERGARRGGRPLRRDFGIERRSLTPDPSEDRRFFGLRRLKWADQSTCLLLSRLPWEVREMIWKHAVGGMTFHMGICKSTRHKGHLGYIVCQSGEPGNPRWCPRKCLRHWHAYQPESPQRMSLAFNYKPIKPPILTLLQTCHQIYSESINIIYVNNIFDTSVSDCTQFLQIFMLPQRFNSIRTVRLEYQVEANPDTETLTREEVVRNQCWDNTWHSLAQMTNLRDLRVKLYLESKNLERAWQSPKTDILDPIKAITRPTRFELILPRWINSSRYNRDFTLESTKWAELPCKLTVSDDNWYDIVGAARHWNTGRFTW